MQKILYIHHGVGVGGAPLSLLQMVLCLDRSKYSPVLLFLHDSDAVKLFLQHGVELIGPVGRTDFSHTKIWWYRWWHVRQLLRAVWDSFCLLTGEAEKWLCDINPDILHLNTSSLLVWGIVARRLGIPVVWHVREPLSPGYFGFRRALVRFVLEKYANKILPICKHDAAPWVSSNKVQVVYNAVDVDRVDLEVRGLDKEKIFKQLGIEPDEKMIFFMGGWSREKGTEFLLQVFEKLYKRVGRVKLVIAGYFNPPWRKKRLPASVVLTGPLQPVLAAQGKGLTNTVSTAILTSISDCLVFPAMVGHFARPVIEAGCLGVPVLASRLAPLDELVIHEKTGLLLPVKIDAWVDALETVCADAEMRARLGKSGKEWCRERFDLNQQKRLVEQVYEKIRR